MKTILLADDSITIQKVVELTFSDGEYRVLCVGNGAQALRKIAESRPDIVLLDVIMPEKNGYEVCESMRTDPATAGIPVLLLTGTFEPFDRRRADAAGADGHLTKPFESHTLVARVEELIAARRSGSLPAHAASPAAPAPAEMPSPFLAAAAASGAATLPEPARPFAPMPAAMAPEPVTETAHPAFASPDASTGGSYMGFADLEVGGDEEAIADRLGPVGGGATMRIDRAPIPVTAAPSPGSGDSGIEGFMPGYELADPPTFPATPSAAAPSAARPLRQRIEEEVPEAAADPTPAYATPAEPNPAALASGLSDETLDRLADLIVRRMSDRVVREIAWDVLPEVAEAVVRERIRALEDAGR